MVITSNELWEMLDLETFKVQAWKPERWHFELNRCCLEKKFLSGDRNHWASEPEICYSGLKIYYSEPKVSAFEGEILTSAGEIYCFDPKVFCSEG